MSPIYLAVGGMVLNAVSVFAGAFAHDDRRWLKYLAVGFGVTGIVLTGFYTGASYGWSTGGSNYLYVGPGYNVVPGNSPHALTPILHKDGDFPIYDVTLFEQDDQAAEQAMQQQAKGALSFRQQQERLWHMEPMGNVNPHSNRMLDNLTWDIASGPDHRSFTFRYIARNGYVRERMGWRRLSEGKYAIAYRVVRETIDGKQLEVLKESADDGYPRDAKGEPVW
jgi:hypothetical protein